MTLAFPANQRTDFTGTAMRPRNLSRIVLIATALACACSRQPSGQASGDPAASTERRTGNSSGRSGPIRGRTYCAALLPTIQGFVTPTLALFAATDSTDPLHLGETPYVECDFRQNGRQLVVGLHDATSGNFTFNAQDSNYAPLAGFGDRARYTTRGAMGMRWADVVKGNAACEVRLTLADSDIKGDWKQAAGNLCTAAFAAM